ncbi:MAG: phosphoribosylglycinamide formyltransferase, partial [Firmicutes bacterium]|nr:phosphoribosylglycinamide formyltransferase [Bacillota bacterium]
MRIVVMASGRGTNLQAILDAVRSGEIDAEVAAVVSDVRDAPALDRARASGVPVAAVVRREFASRDKFEEALAACVESFAPDLIVLAGFMR